jgi:hypothetical protein
LFPAKQRELRLNFLVSDLVAVLLVQLHKALFFFAILGPLRSRRGQPLILSAGLFVGFRRGAGFRLRTFFTQPPLIGLIGPIRGRLGQSDAFCYIGLVANSHVHPFPSKRCSISARRLASAS